MTKGETHTLKEEKFPRVPRRSALDLQPNYLRKDRVIYDPGMKNRDQYVQEIKTISPVTVKSAWHNHISANAAVRRLEWAKIQESPDPDLALQRYNDFNSRWIVYQQYWIEVFKVYRTHAEYSHDPTTPVFESARKFSIVPQINLLQDYRLKSELLPTYFGYSRQVYGHIWRSKLREKYGIKVAWWY